MQRLTVGPPGTKDTIRVHDAYSPLVLHVIVDQHLITRPRYRIDCLWFRHATVKTATDAQDLRRLCPKTVPHRLSLIIQVDELFHQYVAQFVCSY